MPSVANTDRANPRSPPEKGANRHTSSTAKPKEFRLSARRPVESANSSTPYMAAPRQAEGWNPERARNRTSTKAVSALRTALRMGKRQSKNCIKPAKMVMCSPETTRIWETPSCRKRLMSSSETPPLSPSTMARKSPASRRGSSRSMARPTWWRSSTSISPGETELSLSTAMPQYWER